MGFSSSLRVCSAPELGVPAFLLPPESVSICICIVSATTYLLALRLCWFSPSPRYYFFGWPDSDDGPYVGISRYLVLLKVWVKFLRFNPGVQREQLPNYGF